VIFHKIKVSEHIFDQCCHLTVETGSRFPLIQEHCNLEGEVSFEDGGEAVPLQLADLGDDGFLVVSRNVVQIDLQSSL